MGKGEETRRAILSDALAEASVQGFDGLTIGSLAKRTGLSKSGLYAHFDSKEDLQVRVIEEARDRFVDVVISPAFRAPRGEPRLRSIFEHWLAWETHSDLPGGCPFIPAASELDDKPGRARDALVAAQKDWQETLRGAVRIAIEQQHFRPDVDPAQFVYEMWSHVLAYHYYSRLLARDDARQRLQVAFEALLTRCRA